MRLQLDRDALAATVSTLAQDIARAAPECADKALQIVELVQELSFVPDRQAIQDAIEERTLDGDISESRVQLTTSAVLRAMTGRVD